MYSRIMPDVVINPTTHRLPMNATVREAAVVMKNQSVGVVLVMNGAALCGIFSERDLASRVVANGLNPSETTLAEVMTDEVVSISPRASAEEALALMKAHHCRHLPVMEGEDVLAMVSIRDLHRALCHQMEHELHECQQFIFNPY